MSAAHTMSTAPPMQPPWIATSTGTRARSSAVKLSCSRLTNNDIVALRRPGSPSIDRPLLVNTDRSIPALKCLPVEEMTIARTSPESLSSPISCGSSVQNAGIMVFNASGRFNCTWATLSFVVTSKQVSSISAPILAVAPRMSRAREGLDSGAGSRSVGSAQNPVSATFGVHHGVRHERVVARLRQREFHKPTLGD